MKWKFLKCSRSFQLTWDSLIPSAAQFPKSKAARGRVTDKIVQDTLQKWNNTAFHIVSTYKRQTKEKNRDSIAVLFTSLLSSVCMCKRENKKIFIFKISTCSNTEKIFLWKFCIRFTQANFISCQIY